MGNIKQFFSKLLKSRQIGLIRSIISKSRILRIILRILSALIILLVVWDITFNIAYSSLFKGDGKVWNIFLVGADNNNTGGMDKLGNADGEIIVSINKSHRKIVMTSILRDTFLKLDSAEVGNKATLLYHYYGLDTLIDAVEQNLEIPIDNYAVITYPVIMDVVDKLGGIKMDLNKAEIIEMNAKISQLNLELLGLSRFDGIVYVDLDNYEGTHTFNLTGKQAAGLSRVRLSDGSRNDLGRTERERKIILAIKDKFIRAGLFKKISVIRYILSNINTDIPAKKMLSVLISAVELSHYRISSQRIPIDDSYSGENGYIYMDYDINRAFIQETVYGKKAG